MEYVIQKKYSCTETTCGELVAKLKESGGRLDCVCSEFVDPEYPADTDMVHTCWDWIQERSPQKKLYQVREKETTGEVI